MTTPPAPTSQWSDHIRKNKNKELTIYATPEKYSNWSNVLDEAIVEFNKLNLGVKFRRVNVGLDPKVPFQLCWQGTNVQFDACSVRPEYTVCNQKVVPIFEGKVFDGKGLDGATIPLPEFTFIDNKPPIERRIKACIIVPAEPSVPDTMGHGRPVGHRVKLVIAVHELIHACGLIKHSDPGKDVMSKVYRAIPGQNAEDDDVVFPPSPIPMKRISLHPDTAKLIRDNWK